MYGRHRWSGKVAVLSQSRQKLSVWSRAARALPRCVVGRVSAPRERDERRLALVRASCARTRATPPVPSRMLLAISSDRSPCVTVEPVVAGRRRSSTRRRCARSRTAAGSRAAPRPVRCSRWRCAAACPAGTSRRARACTARAVRRSRPARRRGGRPPSSSPSACATWSRAPSCRAGTGAGRAPTSSTARSGRTRRSGRAAHRRGSVNRGGAGRTTRRDPSGATSALTSQSDRNA